MKVYLRVLKCFTLCKYEKNAFDVLVFDFKQLICVRKLF